MAKKDAVSVVVADPTSEVAGVVQTMAGEPGARLPMAQPEGGWPADEFTGIGGSYVRDPFTGVRSRVE